MMAPPEIAIEYALMAAGAAVTATPVMPVPCRWCGASECDCAERVACPKAGAPLHWACGWCEVHAAPRFQCLCGAPASEVPR